MAKPTRILIATSNTGKVREFQDMLAGDARWEFVDLSAYPPIAPPEETGQSFADNSAIKAVSYARAFGVWALADDSGLEVDALAGRPGVDSAVYARLHGAGGNHVDRHLNDADNNALLLKQLVAVPEAQRTARFVCVLTLADAAGRIVATARGTVEGRILREPRGSGGFGYDPLFVMAESGKTTAELPASEKHAISHRGQALRLLRAMMADLPQPGLHS
jgi:XTP/dITP diphosphohydrolase